MCWPSILAAGFSNPLLKSYAWSRARKWYSFLAYLSHTVDSGCWAHLPYKHTLFHKRILYSCVYCSLLSACTHISKTVCTLLVLYTEQAQYLMIVHAHTLTIVQLTVTTDCCYCEQTLSGLSATSDDHRPVVCKLKDHCLFSCLTSLDFLYFSNLWFPGASRCCETDNTQPSMAVHERSHAYWMHW